MRETDLRSPIDKESPSCAGWMGNGKDAFCNSRRKASDDGKAELCDRNWDPGNYGVECHPRVIIFCLPHYSVKISKLGVKLRTSLYWSCGRILTGSPMTWDGCRIYERTFAEGPVIMV